MTDPLAERIGPFWWPGPGSQPWTGPGRVIGHWEEEILYLEDTDTGHIFEVDPRGERPRHFVNSSLEQFRTFAGHLLEHWDATAAMDDDDAIAAVPDLEATLRAVDPQALADTGTFWSLVLEQMADGLL
jgi:hypothetical protein